MPVDILALPAGSLNTKWKEPYASASLNQRFVGIVAPGIYRGLLLVPDPSLGDRTVTVEADVDKLDHVAVYENASGYSISYRDSSSGDITLSLAAYASTTVVISLYIAYAPGVQTTGVYRVYTVAEFNALDPSIKNALVVLGTVAVPASGAIPPANISLLNRTLASANLPRGVIPNAQVIRNPSFEAGETNATHAKSSLFWDKSVTVGTGTWTTSTAQASTGMKSMELNVTAGPLSGDISQQVGVPAREDQLFLVSVEIKQLKTISSGSLSFFMEWSDVNDALLATTTVSLDGGGIDSSFRTVSTIIPAPAGAASLRAVGIRATLLSPSTAGVFGYIDNVDVLVEPLDAASSYPFDQTFRRKISGTGLRVADATGGFSDLVAAARFDRSTPSGEGQLVIEQGNPASLPPALALLGRLMSVGSGLLASEADALKARASAPYGVVAGIDYTLMWESAPASGSTAWTRWYISPTGTFLWTVNAKWNSPSANLWNKDASGVVAFKFEVSGASFQWQMRDASLNTAWADSAWDARRIFRPVSDSSPDYIEEVRDQAGVIRHAIRPVVHAGTVEPVLQVVTSTGQPRFVVDHLGFPNQRIVTRSFWWDQPFGGDPEIGWTYLTSGANSNIITGNSAPTYGAGGCNLLVLSGNALNGFARAFYTPFLHAFNNNSLINALCVVSWSIHVGQQNSRKMVMGLCDSLLFTPGSTDFVGFYRLESDANWKAYTGEGVNQTTTDTGVAVTDASEHQMRIEYQGTGYPGGFATRFFIDDVLVATHTTANRQPNSNLGFLFRADNTSSFAWGSSIAFTSTVMTITLTPQDNLTGRKV